MRTRGLFAVMGVCALAACSDNKGKTGTLTLVEVSSEFAAECDNGGQRVDAGRDTNGNAALDDDEITSSGHICNGKEGGKAPGSGAGSAGKDGKDGGLTAVNVAAEEAGDACVAGGQRIEVGPDADADGKIDAGSTPDVTYVCDGEAGAEGESGHAALVKATTEPVGVSCASGGHRIDYGADTDADGALDADEIEGTRYVCNGASGANGTHPLTFVTDEPAGANCVVGGQRVDSGQDKDDNGTLDAGEVTSTKYVCAGAVGAAAKQSLVTVQNEAAGANCATGGQKILFGLDDDGNGTLAAGEVDGTKFVCNGVVGKAALVALVALSPEPPGANCAAGGSKVDLGLDDDADKTLDAVEIDATSFVCDFEDFENGSFELPGYAGWTVTSTQGGQWLLVDDGTILKSGDTVFDWADKRDEMLTSTGLPLTVAATNGTKVSVQQQFGPGIHRIFQDFRVPRTATKLTWDMYYKNMAPIFNANSQYIAVNIRKVSDDTVVTRLFQTKPGDPMTTMGMQPFTADLTAFAGTVVRLDVEGTVQINWLDAAFDNFVIQ